ncbi:hypothetical protein LTR37_018071 [Vermiconidia calcicola]|uniref:Uncharacterized protein n=1 Tax=Vermiconidia calcicola TaxID=1690605 RepID=A0ACC3MJ67_9PEZI|nr:hypothetical protein LTR37_018071 [Vermiconidia calcicola]
MPNAMPDHRRAGRLPLPARAPTVSTTANESSGSPPTSPTFASPSSTPPWPLTPANTFSSRSGSVDAGTINLSEVLAGRDDSGNRVLDPQDLSDEPLEHVQPASEEQPDDSVEGEADVEDTRSKRPHDLSPSSSRNTMPTRPNEHHRSASVPNRPLKSAIITAPPPATRSSSQNGNKKRAHFKDDSATADPKPQSQSTARGRSAPVRSEALRNAVERDLALYEQHRSEDTAESESRGDDELNAAIGVFEAVVEELVQVAEEHAEAHADLMNVAREVADAIWESQDEVYDGDDEDDGRLGGDRDKMDYPPVADGRERGESVSQGSADEDVDESCIAHANSKVDELGRNIWHHRPDILFLTPDGELKHAELQPIAEELSSSTEIVECPNSAAWNVIAQRGVSDPQSHATSATASDRSRRRASMPDFITLRRQFNPMPMSSKAGPASCAVTVCSVRASEPPKLNTVYEHPGAQYSQLDDDSRPLKTAQTVRSESGTFQVSWEERPTSSSDSDVTIFDSSIIEPGDEITKGELRVFQAPSAMDKVGTKLAAWSWAKEQDQEDGRDMPNWLPLFFLNDDRLVQQPSKRDHSSQTEEPFAPPNTERPSGASSAKASAPGSPLTGPEASPELEDDEGDKPIELVAKTRSPRPPDSHAYTTRSTDNYYLGIPDGHASHGAPASPAGTKEGSSISRQLSDLADEEKHFQAHRDSMVLLQNRKQHEGKTNQQLMNSRDSVILARSKFSGDTRPAWSGQVGALSSIRDASPSDSRKDAGIKAMAKVLESPDGRRNSKPAEESGHDKAHPDEHVGCPIYEVERPRWVEADRKNGPFV